MLDKVELTRIKKAIRSDKRLNRLERAFNELPEYSLNIKELYEEIERIHMTRKARLLNKNDESFVQDITESLIDDQAQRSRLAEILMGCNNVINNLNNTLDTIEGYLITEYSSLLSTIRTKGERQSFIRHHVLIKYIRYVHRATRIKEAAEIVIVDIDKAGFMFKNLIEAVKLATGRREMV